MRSVVITGVSRGLGAALFDEFHAAGDRILALGRRFTDAQHAAAKLSTSEHIRLRIADLADPASLPNAAELAAFLDGAGSTEIVLVHNASVFEPFGPIGTLDPAGIAAAVAVNLTAPMLLTNALLSTGVPGIAMPTGAATTGAATADAATADAATAGAATADAATARQLPGQRVTVMYISSSAAHRVGGGRSVYGSTKRAGEMFFETLTEERAGGPGVRVIIVDPGIMDTDMQAVVRRHAREDAYFPGRERFIERYERHGLPSPATVARKIFEAHFAERP